MIGWLSEAYPWIKSLHIVSMVAWMAGLLYLPRLYVYHSMAPVESDLLGDLQSHGTPPAARHHDTGNGCYMGFSDCCSQEHRAWSNGGWVGFGLNLLLLGH